MIRAVPCPNWYTSIYTFTSARLGSLHSGLSGSLLMLDTRSRWLSDSRQRRFLFGSRSRLLCSSSTSCGGFHELLGRAASGEQWGLWLKSSVKASVRRFTPSTLPRISRHSWNSQARFRSCARCGRLVSKRGHRPWRDSCCRSSRSNLSTNLIPGRLERLSSETVSHERACHGRPWRSGWRPSDTSLYRSDWKLGPPPSAATRACLRLPTPAEKCLHRYFHHPCGRLYRWPAFSGRAPPG